MLMTNVLYGPQSNASEWPGAVLALEIASGSYTWTFHSIVSDANDEAAWIRPRDGRIMAVLRHDTTGVRALDQCTYML
jgi:hypothetical protein